MDMISYLEGKANELLAISWRMRGMYIRDGSMDAELYHIIADYFIGCGKNIDDEFTAMGLPQMSNTAEHLARVMLGRDPE